MAGLPHRSAACSPRPPPTRTAGPSAIQTPLPTSPLLRRAKNSDLYIEAWRRGWSRARQKVVLSDGAIWIWNLADQHFPGAIQIVDLYDARQHIWKLAAKGRQAFLRRW